MAAPALGQGPSSLSCSSFCLSALSQLTKARVQLPLEPRIWQTSFFYTLPSLGNPGTDTENSLNFLRLDLPHVILPRRLRLAFKAHGVHLLGQVSSLKALSGWLGLAILSQANSVSLSLPVAPLHSPGALSKPLFPKPRSPAPPP